MSEENNTPEFLQPDADEVEVPSLPRCPREKGRKNGKKTRGNSAGSSRSRSSVRGQNGGNKDRGQNRGNKDGDRNGRKGGSNTSGTNESSKHKRNPGSGDTPTEEADCNRFGVGGRQSDAWQTADEAFSPSPDEQPPRETNVSARQSDDSPDSNVNAPPNNAKGKKPYRCRQSDAWQTADEAFSPSPDEQPPGETNVSARKSADSPDSNVNAPPNNHKPHCFLTVKQTY